MTTANPSRRETAREYQPGRERHPIANAVGLLGNGACRYRRETRIDGVARRLVGKLRLVRLEIRKVGDRIRCARQAPPNTP